MGSSATIARQIRIHVRMPEAYAIVLNAALALIFEIHG